MAAATDDRQKNTSRLADTVPLSEAEQKIAATLIAQTIQARINKGTSDDEKQLEKQCFLESECSLNNAQLYTISTPDIALKNTQEIVSQISDRVLARITDATLLTDGAEKILQLFDQTPGLQSIWCERISKYRAKDAAFENHRMQPLSMISPFKTLLGIVYYHQYLLDPLKPEAVEEISGTPQQERKKVLEKAAAYNHFLARAHLIQMDLYPLSEELIKPEQNTTSSAATDRKIGFTYDSLAKIISDHKSQLEKHQIPGYIQLAILRIFAAKFFGKTKEFLPMQINYQLALQYLQIALRLPLGPEVKNAFWGKFLGEGFVGKKLGLFKFTASLPYKIFTDPSPTALCSYLEEQCQHGFVFFARNAKTNIPPKMPSAIPFGKSLKEVVERETLRITAATLQEEIAPTQRTPAQ